jgi:carboxyl-terminal processing protease
MPRRNLLILLAVLAVALASYHKAQRNRFAGMFGEALARIRDEYIEEVDPRSLFESAMVGMVRTLDENSQFLGEKEMQELEETSLTREIGGIGVQLDPDEKQRLVVWDIVPNTPAARAGLRAGDRIVAIDGASTDSLTQRQAVERIKGTPGTPVALDIVPAGRSQPTRRRLVRERFTAESVLGDRRNEDGSWEFALPQEPRLKHVRITNFSAHTADELKSALDTLVKEGAAGIVLDLRGNTGGLLDKAVAIADMFLSEGTIVTTRDRRGRVTSRYTADADSYGDLPLAVLIDGASASASEIVAAALQDHRRAVVIGRQSFGKGTVQKLFTLEPKKSQIKVTTATYWRPSGRNIHRTKENSQRKDEWGVRPDSGFEVLMTDKEQERLIRWRRERDRFSRPPPISTPKPPEPDGQVGKNGGGEDSHAGASATDGEDAHVDPALEKAVQYLRGKIEGR